MNLAKALASKPTYKSQLYFYIYTGNKQLENEILPFKIP